MQRPFEFVECKVQERDEFVLTEGTYPVYLLIWLKEGSFRLSIEGKTETVTAGDCVIFPENLNFFRSVITPISFVMLKFKMNPRCPFTVPVPCGKITFPDPQRFADSMRQYESLMDADDARTIYYKEHLLEDILWQAFMYQNRGRVMNGEEQWERTRDPMVLTAVCYIRDHIGEKLSIPQICHEAKTNISTLNFKFKKELDCTVGEFVTTEKMKKARKLLANTTYPIGETAIRCGYENIYYFSKVFKKENGSSPSEYRRQYR